MDPQKFADFREIADAEGGWFSDNKLRLFDPVKIKEVSEKLPSSMTGGRFFQNVVNSINYIDDASFKVFFETTLRKLDLTKVYTPVLPLEPTNQHWLASAATSVLTFSKDSQPIFITDCILTKEHLENVISGLFEHSIPVILLSVFVSKEVVQHTTEKNIQLVYSSVLPSLSSKPWFQLVYIDDSSFEQVKKTLESVGIERPDLPMVYFNYTHDIDAHCSHFFQLLEGCREPSTDRVAKYISVINTVAPAAVEVPPITECERLHTPSPKNSSSSLSTELTQSQSLSKQVTWWSLNQLMTMDDETKNTLNKEFLRWVFCNVLTDPSPKIRVVFTFDDFATIRHSIVPEQLIPFFWFASLCYSRNINVVDMYREFGAHESDDSPMTIEELVYHLTFLLAGGWANMSYTCPMETTQTEIPVKYTFDPREFYNIVKILENI